MKTERITYHMTLSVDLIEKLKYLAVKEDVHMNDLLEEAIEDFLVKYGNRPT